MGLQRVGHDKNSFISNQFILIDYPKHGEKRQWNTLEKTLCVGYNSGNENPDGKKQKGRKKWRIRIAIR